MAVAIVVMLFAVCIPMSGSSSAADNTILFKEVNPAGEYEGFSLYNYSNSKINLKGYEITDREGTLSVTSDLFVEPSALIIFAAKSDPSDLFSSRPNTHVIGSSGITKTGTFTLNDRGDDLYLYNGKTLIDTVCYGTKTADAGWSGPPVDISSSKYILRVGMIDTDKASDWVLTKFGVTNLPFDPSLKFNAVVTPFTFPEGNGGAIYKELEQANTEVLISIYQLTSYNLVALLCDLEKKGVDVTILLEGDVLNYDMSNELSCMKSIVDAGGEVFLINTPAGGNYERYNFVHNKYAVIDSKKVIITTENWTIANMGTNKSNRGWGATIESVDYARYMTDVFNNDVKQEYGDVFELTDMYPSVKSYSGLPSYSSPPFTYETKGFSATVTPILSPDNSYEALHHYMDGAKYRLFSEQLDIGSTFSNVSDISPVSWMDDASKRGVDARFILDIATSSNKESHTKEVNIINTTTSVKATTINGGDGFSTTHNKGIIIDDTVWVGSVNWTEPSFTSNRETAVLIDSKEVTDFYAGYFMKDWNANTTDTEVKLQVSSDKDRIFSNEIVTFSVSDSTAKKYIWDIYGDGNSVESGTNRIARNNLVPGTYTLTVTLDDGRSAEFTYTVEKAAGPSGEGDDDNGEGEGFEFQPVMLLVLLIPVLAIIAIVRKKSP